MNRRLQHAMRTSRQRRATFWLMMIYILGLTVICLQLRSLLGH